MDRPDQPTASAWAWKDSNTSAGVEDSSMTASALSSLVLTAELMTGGGSGVKRDGSPSEEKTASPPASSAVCSALADPMVSILLL